jgi:Flp pilus assembly protein TadD
MFLAGQGDFAPAKEEFASALLLQPRNVTALNGRGAILLRDGDIQSATRDFEQCIQIAPDFDRPYLNMAAVFFNSGRLQQAHDLLAGYLQQHPDNQEVKDVLAQVDSKR